VVDLCASKPTVIDSFVPQLVPSGQRGASVSSAAFIDQSSNSTRLYGQHEKGLPDTMPPPRGVIPSSYSSSSAAQSLYGFGGNLNNMSNGSVAVLSDKLGMDMRHIKNAEQQDIVVRTVALRLYNESERLRGLTGQSPELTTSYAVHSLIYYGDVMYNSQLVREGGDPEQYCRLWELWLFRSCSEEIQGNAIFLLWEPQRSLQRHRSLYLEYFLRVGPGEVPSLVNMFSIRAALESLEDFFELFYGWRGLFRELLRCFRNNDFDIYSVDYVASQIYSALSHLSEKARQACDTSVTSSQWLDYFVTYFAGVKSRMSYEKSKRYELYNLSAAVTPGLPLTHSSSGSASGPQSPAPPLKVYTEQQLAYFGTQVCVNDLMGVLKVKGKNHRECASNCPRRHMPSLLAAPYSASSLCDQIQSVVKDKPLAVKVIAAIRADNSGYFSQ
jgi:hypothetical protein